MPSNKQGGCSVHHPVTNVEVNFAFLLALTIEWGKSLPACYSIWLRDKICLPGAIQFDKQICLPIIIKVFSCIVKFDFFPTDFNSGSGNPKTRNTLTITIEIGISTIIVSIFSIPV